MRKPTADLDAVLCKLREERAVLLEARAGRVRAMTSAEAADVEAVVRDTAWFERRLRPARNAALVLDRDVRERGALVPLCAGSFALGLAAGAGITPAIIALAGTFVAWLASRLLGSIWLG